MPGYSDCGTESRMTAELLSATPLSMPIDGIPWSWRSLGPPELQPLLPLVQAVDPSGAEAMNWPLDAERWLAEQPCRRGLVGVQCLAGLTLALFFYDLKVDASGTRHLAVERLRWLELARPHRSLDALLAILIDTAGRLGCSDIVIGTRAAAERTARAALEARAAAAGFTRGPQGWRRSTSH
jgi:hypothetical protein